MRTLDGKSSILQCSGFQSKACTEFSAQTAPKLLVLCARNIAGACFVSESGRRSRGSRGSRPSALLTQSVRLHSAVECSQKNGGAHRLKLAGIFGCNRPPAPIPVSAQPEALPCSPRFALEIPSPKVPCLGSLHSVGHSGRLRKAYTRSHDVTEQPAVCTAIRMISSRWRCTRRICT